MASPIDLPQTTTTTAFVPRVRLRPTLPSHRNKYSGPLGPLPSPSPIQPQSIVPALSFVNEPHPYSTELELEWVAFVHPDGDRYYWHRKLNIVTPSDAHRANYDAIFRDARKTIEELARGQGADIRDAETFLSVAETYGNIVNLDYYMVDHDKSVLFWLQPVDVDQELLGVHSFESKEHLYLALTTEYWVHLESYPAHRTVSQSAVDELASLLIHNGTDDVTSQGSISPWSVDECLRYLRLFSEFRDKGPSSYRTASIARVWSTISRVRYMNRHGLPGPRLDRFQGIDSFIAGQLKYSIVLSIAELMCFNLPKGMFYQLSELWNGRLVYIRHWDRFLDAYRETCLRMAVVSGGIICLTTLLLSSKSFNNGSVAAASLGSIALLTSLYLYERHSKSKLGTAMDVSAYLSRNESFRYGLRPLSIILSLPQALTIWAGLLFQIGLMLLVKPLDGSPAEATNHFAWIAPPITASVVFLATGGHSI